MKVNDKVIYNSMTGSVTAKVVGIKPSLGGRSIERLVLRSTSRTNRTYPAGFEWEVPAGASSLLLLTGGGDR